MGLKQKVMRGTAGEAAMARLVRPCKGNGRSLESFEALGCQEIDYISILGKPPWLQCGRMDQRGKTKTAGQASSLENVEVLQVTGDKERMSKWRSGV